MKDLEQAMELTQGQIWLALVAEINSIHGLARELTALRQGHTELQRSLGELARRVEYLEIFQRRSDDAATRGHRTRTKPPKKRHRPRGSR